MRRAVILGMLGLVVLASCSVKEDRGDCPCWLTVRASYPNERVSAWYGSQPIFENQDGQQVDRQVPRGIVDVVASRGKFIAQEGHQMDELFASLTQVDTQCEEAEVRFPTCTSSSPGSVLSSKEAKTDAWSASYRCKAM